MGDQEHAFAFYHRHRTSTMASAPSSPCVYPRGDVAKFENLVSDILGPCVLLAHSCWRRATMTISISLGFGCLDRSLMAMRLIVESI